MSTAEMQERFTCRLLARHRGKTEPALVEVRELLEMSEYGRSFYVVIERALYLRLTMERDAWRH